MREKAKRGTATYGVQFLDPAPRKNLPQKIKNDEKKDDLFTFYEMKNETQDPIVTSRGATDSIENARSTNSSLVDPIL